MLPGRLDMVMLLWILGAAIAIFGVVLIVQEMVVAGIVAIVLGVALGPVSTRLLKV